MEIHDPSQNAPRPRPKFGGRLVGETRPEPVAPVSAPPAPAPEASPKPRPKFGQRETQPVLTADRAVSNVAPPPVKPHKVRQPRKESPYKTPGTCKITGRAANLDDDGISSYGRSRMRSRIRYQQAKCASKNFEFLTAILDKLRKEGIFDASVDALLFNGEALANVERVNDEYADAEVYSPPKPRVRKDAPKDPI